MKFVYANLRAYSIQPFRFSDARTNASVASERGADVISGR